MRNLHRLPVPDDHLAYRDTGSGPLVVLLHGGALDHRMWDQQIPALAEQFRVIAPDARGHGDSSTPTVPFRHCDDLAALIRHLDVGPVHLVGLSMGGGTAVDTALEHPELVASMVISGVGTSEAEFHDRWVLDIQTEWARTAAAGDAAGWLDAFLLFAPGPHRTMADVDPDVVARLREQATATLAAHLSGGPPPVLAVRHTWERVPTITQPVLVVSGGLDSDDHIAMGERLARLVPDGRSVRIDGTAHYPNMERPAEFTSVVKDFLQRITTTTP